MMQRPIFASFNKSRTYLLVREEQRLVKKRNLDRVRALLKAEGLGLVPHGVHATLGPRFELLAANEHVRVHAHCTDFSEIHLQLRTRPLTVSFASSTRTVSLQGPLLSR